VAQTTQTYPVTVQLPVSQLKIHSVLANGIQAGESLGITFNLLDGVTFLDTKNAPSTGALIIGVHAQDLGAGLDDGFCESLITTIPIPATTWLLGSGLIGLMRFAKRKKK